MCNLLGQQVETRQNGIRSFMPYRFFRLPARRAPEGRDTLIEMMVVLVIIAIVAAMVVPNVINRPDRARVTVAETDIRSISSALELYRLDNRTYPTTAQGLAALVSRPSAAPAPANWAEGGYLADLPRDPWDNPYVYASPGRDGAYELVSLGADGAEGGEGTAADIARFDRTAAN
jgi:general secretion pathway protein G